MDKEITPYHVTYPHLRWVNLMDSYDNIKAYSKLAPSAQHHPLYSIFGITYTCTHTVVLANLVEDKEERRVLAESSEKAVITNLNLLPESSRISSKPMLLLLILERYVYDLPFRRVIADAVRDNVHFDVYIPRNGKCYSSFYTYWYPDLINSLVRAHRHKTLDGILSKLPKADNWYLPYLYCSPDEFRSAFKLLIKDFYNTRTIL